MQGRVLSRPIRPLAPQSSLAFPLSVRAEAEAAPTLLQEVRHEYNEVKLLVILGVFCVEWGEKHLTFTLGAHHQWFGHIEIDVIGPHHYAPRDSRPPCDHLARDLGVPQSPCGTSEWLKERRYTAIRAGCALHHPTLHRGLPAALGPAAAPVGQSGTLLHDSGTISRPNDLHSPCGHATALTPIRRQLE
eukprot:TRINITY_DN35136_c0_g1_i4.p3 TRINITY_DN35136_c0_g1~~TRINITY_DN35136_c0_g1_i4.p3  ORF type:complete len:189 (-),score=9.14 TRINITY_DN35136_c0_g1_i4:379-945(-)